MVCVRNEWTPMRLRDEKSKDGIWIMQYIFVCRSQWPRGLRRRSAAARLLRLWVRIPPGAWMSVCWQCCVLSGRGLCDGLITRPEESYRLWCVVVCVLETSSRMRRTWPALGCSAMGLGGRRLVINNRPPDFSKCQYCPCQKCSRQPITVGFTFFFISSVVPCSGIRGTYKHEQSYLFIYKCRSNQNLL